VLDGEHAPDLVLDMRSAERFRRGHIAGAINLPYERFQSEAEARSAGVGWVLVVDPGGARAAEMAVWLRGRGIQAAFLQGGMSAWVGPLEKG